MPRLPQPGVPILLACILALPLSMANAEKISPPDVPTAIHAPAGEEVVLLAHASGSQIYTCKVGRDAKFAWTLKAPGDEPKDGNGKVLGHHSARPGWKLNNG